MKELTRIAGVNIREPRPDEDAFWPGILLLNQVMLTSSTDQNFLLLPVPISKNAYQKIVHHIQTRFPDIQIDAGELLDVKIRLQSDINRKVQSEEIFREDAIKVVSENVRCGTTPPLIPFLMIPLPTERRQDNSTDS